MNNIANILTVTRLALLPFIIALLYAHSAWAAWTVLVLYIIGALTDWLDGWVARRYDQISDFGKFMDPVSDKIFVVTLLMMLVATHRIEHFLVLAVIIILVREFLVSGIREFLAPKGISLPVTKLAKWKTATQMIATGLLIIGPAYPLADLTGGILLCAAAALTVITGWDYLKTAWRYLA